MRGVNEELEKGEVAREDARYKMRDAGPACSRNAYINPLVSFYASANPKYSLTFDFEWKKENRTLVSTIRNIYNNPCLLATLSFNSSPNSFACFSVNLDLERILSAKIHNTSSVCGELLILPEHRGYGAVLFDLKGGKEEEKWEKKRKKKEEKGKKKRKEGKE